MATAVGPSTLDLAAKRLQEELEREPGSFRFFQAVRLLERLTPHREPVGRFHDPADEAIHFASHASISFPPSEIQSLEWNHDEPSKMTVNFMGLTGPQGVLPLFYTAWVIERIRVGDTGVRDFFDIFNHRLISLFYRAWEKYRFAIAYERREADAFSHHLLDLLGLGTPGLQDRQDVPDESLMYYAGLLAQQPHSAIALQQLLEDYFQVDVAIEQFCGGWYPLASGNQTQLQEGATMPERLGGGAVVGDEIWDQQSRVRIRLGPLGLSDYLEFLPDGALHRQLHALLRFFSGHNIEFEVQLVLKHDEVPACEIGTDDQTQLRLGWVTWIKSQPMDHNPSDTILEL